jgi:K+/H+ antiporter YhaU regulatory subunit KhtT
MRRLIQLPLLLLAMLLVGAFGLRVLTGQPLLDCFYQAVMLLTTVGAQEPPDLTAGTKVFIALYLFGGIGVFTYSLFQFGQILVSGDLRIFLERRQMKKATDQLSDHFIICGYGRMGATLCEYLHRRGQSFVIVAGATRVINPLASGATRMARLMLSPSIENFVEVAESHGIEWEIADVQVPVDSPLVHRQISDTPLRDAGIILLGVCRESGETHFPPPANLTIEPGDSLFAFGRSEKMSAFPSLLDGEQQTSA